MFIQFAQHGDAPFVAPITLAQLLADEYEVGISIHKTDQNSYELRHTDFVANEWVEEYDELSVLLARLAVLVHCAETGWDAGYADAEAEEFSRRAIGFLADSTVMFC